MEGKIIYKIDNKEISEKEFFERAEMFEDEVNFDCPGCVKKYLLEEILNCINESEDGDELIESLDILLEDVLCEVFHVEEIEC